jgi:hypothetical protein
MNMNPYLGFIKADKQNSTVEYQKTHTVTSLRLASNCHDFRKNHIYLYGFSLILCLKGECNLSPSIVRDFGFAKDLTTIYLCSC